jgi:hypothetical protein
LFYKLPTVTDILSQAADLVEKGWVQGSRSGVVITDYSRDRGYRSGRGYCVLGAIDMAVAGSPELDRKLLTPQQAKLRRQARRKIRRHAHCLAIWKWNDNKYRKQAEVVRVLRAAAK